MRTELCDRFEIDVPIFAFSHCRDVVAAVTNAGGMGVLGALAFSPEQLDLELKWIDEHVNGKPYGVDIVMPANYTGKEEGLGRSEEGNDHLSMRLARGKDLFFHLDGAPGSHVILRTEGRPDPPQESVLEASELAVHFSKQKNASRADVHVVPIKNVRKPKGTKKGLVYVTGGKTVHLRREEARLERVLESRIDD